MTQIKNELIPIRPSNQSDVRVDFHLGQYYAICGGVCALSKTREGAIEAWRETQRRRSQLGFK